MDVKHKMRHVWRLGLKRGYLWEIVSHFCSGEFNLQDVPCSGRLNTADDYQLLAISEKWPTLDVSTYCRALCYSSYDDFDEPVEEAWHGEKYRCIECHPNKLTKNIINRILVYFLSWNGTLWTHFWSESSLETKNGMSTTTWSGRSFRYKRWRNSICIRRRWCLMFGGTTKECCSSSYSQLGKLHKTTLEKRSKLLNKKGVVFHHAWSHTSLVTKKKLQSFG